MGIFLIVKMCALKGGEDRLSKYNLVIDWHTNMLCFLCCRSEEEGKGRKEEGKRVEEKGEEGTVTNTGDLSSTSGVTRATANYY